MKIKILLFSTLVLNILADQYTGTISIAKTHKFIKLCDASEEAGYYEISSIYHLPKARSFPEFYHNKYRKYGHILPDNFGPSIIIIPSDEIEQTNRYHRQLMEKYNVMPHYWLNLNVDNEIYLRVKITLQRNDLFHTVTYCWLPLNLFENEDGSFKQPGEVIERVQSFKDYKDQHWNTIFKLTLDNTFGDILWHYQEFLEDFQKPCHLQTKNCLVRAFKRLRKQLGY